MVPLIPIALTLAKEFLPSLVGKIAGDKSGKVAQQVVDAAAGMTGVAINNPTDAEAAAEAMRQNPELAVQFQTRMAEIELQETEAFLNDRQDARGRDIELAKAGKTNWRADAMVLSAFVALTVIAVFLIMANKVDVGVLTFLTTIGGMMMKNISTAFDFEFGSSRSSKGKSDDMGQMMKKLANLKRGDG